MDTLLLFPLYGVHFRTPYKMRDAFIDGKTFETSDGRQYHHSDIAEGTLVKLQSIEPRHAYTLKISRRSVRRD